MGQNTINLCTSNGLYGVYIDGSPLATIFAVVFLIYTFVLAIVCVLGYWLHQKYQSMAKRSTVSKPQLSANLFDEERDYSHEAMLGL